MRPDRFRPLFAALIALGLAASLAVAPAAAQGTARPAAAAKVPPAPANPWVFDAAAPTVLRLDGEIVPGAAAAFEAELAANPGITTLILRGDGNSQAETIAIASRVRDLGLTTRIEAGDYCYLACGIIFLAGPERRAEGILCVAVLFADTLDLERAQLDLADFIELVMSFNLTPDLLSSVVETASGGAYCFSPHEIARFGVDAPVLNAPEGWNATPYAVLYEQPHEDAPDGTAWPSFTAVSHWTLEEGPNGPAIRLQAEVPDLGIAVAVTIVAQPAIADRDNRGTTVTIHAETPEGFHGGAIAGVEALLSRMNEATAGIGGFYDVENGRMPGTYTVHVEGDLAWPLARVHFSRRWLSFILTYENGGRNELLIEVGEEGRAVIDQAYTVWDAMVPVPRPTKP